MATYIELYGKQKWEDGFTRLPHISRAMLAVPYVDKAIRNIDVDQYSITGLINKIAGGIKSSRIQSDKIEWYINNNNTFTKLSALISDPDSLGLNGEKFNVVLEDNYYKSNEVVEFQSGAQAIIYGDPAPSAKGGYLYTMQLIKKELSLHPNLDTAGTRVAFRYNLHPQDMSDKGTSRVFLSEKFGTTFSTMRMSASISRAAQSQILMYGMFNEKGDKVDFWQYEQEYQFNIQWSMMNEMWLWHGQSAQDTYSANKSHLFDINGNIIRSGSGLWEYLQDSQVKYYLPEHDNGFEFWQEIISDAIEMSPSKANKEYTLFCGQELYKHFQRDNHNYLQRYPIMSNDLVAYKKGNGKVTIGVEFDEIKGLYGCTLKIIPVHAWSNRNVYGNRLHKLSGKPLQAYKGCLIDTSIIESEPNLCIYYKGGKGVTDSEAIEWEVPGAISMKGNPGRFRASAFDGTQMYKLVEKALVFKYPYSSVIIEPIY